MTAEHRQEHSTRFVEWGEPAISMRFAELRQNREGDLISWLEVTIELPNVGPVLHDKKLNLSSSSAQQSWAKYLSERTTRYAGAELDWAGKLETACRMPRSPARRRRSACATNGTVVLSYVAKLAD